MLAVETIIIISAAVVGFILFMSIGLYFVQRRMVPSGVRLSDVSSLTPESDVRLSDGSLIVQTKILQPEHLATQKYSGPESRMPVIGTAREQRRYEKLPKHQKTAERVLAVQNWYGKNIRRPIRRMMGR